MTVWSSRKILTTYCNLGNNEQRNWMLFSQSFYEVTLRLQGNHTTSWNLSLFSDWKLYYHNELASWNTECFYYKYTVKRPNFVSCTFLCPILGIFVASIINKLQVFTVGNQILRSFERWNPMKKIEKTTKCQSQVSVLNFDEQKFNLPIN